jgi:hypothetical protein
MDRRVHSNCQAFQEEGARLFLHPGVTLHFFDYVGGPIKVSLLLSGLTSQLAKSSYLVGCSAILTPATVSIFGAKHRLLAL